MLPWKLVSKEAFITMCVDKIMVESQGGSRSRNFFGEKVVFKVLFELFKNVLFKDVEDLEKS